MAMIYRRRRANVRNCDIGNAETGKNREETAIAHGKPAPVAPSGRAAAAATPKAAPRAKSRAKPKGRARR